MRVLNPPFCPVCKEAIAKQIQLLVDPLERITPEADEVYFLDEPILFGAQLLMPHPNTLKTDWVLDNLEIAQSDSFFLIDTHLMNLSHQLSLTYVDTTHFIRDLEHRSSHNHSIHWEVNTALSTPVQESEKFLWIIYPNPASQYITISRSTASQRPILIQVTDLLGRVLWKGQTYQSQRLNISSLSPGPYHLTLIDSHQKQVFSFIKT